MKSYEEFINESNGDEQNGPFMYVSLDGEYTRFSSEESLKETQPNATKLEITSGNNDSTSGVADVYFDLNAIDRFVMANHDADDTPTVFKIEKNTVPAVEEGSFNVLLFKDNSADPKDKGLFLFITKEDISKTLEMMNGDDEVNIINQEIIKI